jgi:hypothetical protein
MPKNVGKTLFRYINNNCFTFYLFGQVVYIGRILYIILLVLTFGHITQVDISQLGNLHTFL